ncbi:MAG: hypothetical protein KDK29_00115 [Sedimentitalea sp.]|nr:hypothetical protein [Sedimentitalea sp.]
MHWLLRMSRWARNPPSERRVLMVLAVILACLAVVGAERAGLWPDWATAERMRR